MWNLCWIIVEYTSQALDGQRIKIVDIAAEDIIIGTNQTKPTVYLGYFPWEEYYVSIEPLKQNTTCLNKGSFDTDVIIGQYYAIDYMDRFYIGWILNTRAEKKEHFKVKFLHQISKFS